MNKLIEIIACSYISILVFAIYILAFLAIDFTLYCLTNKCILHTIYAILEKELKQ